VLLTTGTIAAAANKLKPIDRLFFIVLNLVEIL
jgi:hypothetical protein